MMLGVDPRFLRTFVTVVRLASFSAAARELGYTQSAVSQHIAALESDLGTPLLRRRPVEPTAAGERLLEHARPILLRLDAARAEILRLAPAASVRLALGASPLAAMARLAAALERVRRALPRLEASVRVTDTEGVAVAVATGELEAGLVDGIAAPNDPLRLPEGVTLTAVAVAEDPLVAALPADHPLGGGQPIRLDHLADARWLDAPDVIGPLAAVRAAAGTDGFRPALRYTGADVAGMLALVAAGHGIALVPERVVGGTAGVRGVPIAAPRLVHRTELLRTGSPSVVVDALAAALGD
jgi:DNA-binding transcriptional LysR family regulator